MSLRILVCLKQILDPEVPPRDFRVDSQRKQADASVAGMVTNIFCENALETALQLRESTGGEITALTFAAADAEDVVLRKALALKADTAVRIDNPLESRVGSPGSAAVVAAAVQKLGPFDLILLGRESGDWGEGQTAGLLAEHLGLPFVSLVDEIEATEEGLLLGRQTDFGHERLRANAPMVLSITNTESNVPRIPKTRDIMMASRKSITVMGLEELGMTADGLAKQAGTVEVVDLVVPDKTIECELIKGDNSDQRIEEFAKRIAAIVDSA